MSNTVIALRSSGAVGNTPNPLSLTYGEFALNYADGIIYYRTASDTLGSIFTTQPAGLNQELQFNDSGSFGTSANLKYFKANNTLQSSNVNIRQILSFSDSTIQTTAWTGADTYARNKANGAYDAANTAVTTGQANVGAGLIATTSAYQANVGAGLLATKSAYEANVGAGLIIAGNKISSAFGQANLAFDQANTKVSKSGDVMSGTLQANNIISNTSITVGTTSIGGVSTNTFTTSSTSQVSVDAFPKTAYRSAKYFIQMTSSTSYHIIELSLVHDDTTVYLSQYGEIFNTASLGTFDATIATGSVFIMFTPVNSTTTVNLIRTSIVA